MFLLDTNAISELQSKRADKNVRVGFFGILRLRSFFPRLLFSNLNSACCRKNAKTLLRVLYCALG